MPDMTNVFIPIELPERSGAKFTDKGFDIAEFDRLFDYDGLASDLTEKIRRSKWQVGKTYEEAVAIVNQHSHYSYMLIVEVCVPSTRIEKPQSEAENMPSSVLNASNKKYPILLANTQISRDDILSALPMYLYLNSTRFLCPREDIIKLWPKGHVLPRANTIAPVTHAAAAGAAADMPLPASVVPASTESKEKSHNAFLLFVMQNPALTAGLAGLLVAAIIAASVVAAVTTVAVAASIGVSCGLVAGGFTFFGIKATQETHADPVLGKAIAATT